MTAKRDPIEVLRASLDERAAETAGVERVESGALVEYRLGGRAVAVADRAAVSFRVGEAVAAAAARTADARASTRGTDWVELAATGSDRFTLDRARAWFDLAIRNAGEAGRRPD